jgi:uncharacterized protein YwgA
MRVKDKLDQLYGKLDVDPSLTTFSNRKLLQKLTYLIEVFGIDLGFRFSWYVHGPYDRNLTTVLYDDSPEASGRNIDDIPDEDKKLNSLKKFLGRDITSSRTLELIVSLHYLNHLGKKDGLTDSAIIDRLVELKPQFTKDEAKYYLKKIHEFFG